jgi:hypothetical protein
MAPIVLLRLFRADGDFNQATPHPADPIKCRTSTQRTQAPESVDTGRASRLDPLENSIDVKRTLRLRYVAHIRPRRETRPRPRSGILRPRGFRHHGEGLVGYQVALTREGARRQSDARLEEMMRERSLRQTLKLGADYRVPLHFPDRDLATGVLQKDVRSRQRRFQSRASPALDCRDGKWPLSVAAQFSLRRTRMRRIG